MSAREVLRERNFRLLVGARTISFFGTNLAPIAVAFAVLGIDNSATAVGLSFAAWTLAQISTLLVGGVVADRLPRQRVMIASDSASFAIRLTMGVLLVSGHAQVWELIALQACGGAAVAFHSPATTGIVPQTVPARLLQQANGLMAIARYAAFPLGAAAGGTLVATIGAGWALLLDAATYGTSALFLSQLRLPAAARVASAPNFVRELREGWNAFTEQTWVWVLTTWISLYFLFTLAPFFVLGPYIAKQSLGGAGAWAVIVTGEAVGSLVGGLAGVRFMPRRPMVTTSLLFLAAAAQCVLLARHAPVAAIAGAALVTGFAFAFGGVVWDTAIQRTIAPEKLSRVISYGWFAAMVFLPAGYALAGPVGDAVGMAPTLYFSAAWIVVSTAAIMLVRAVREFGEEVYPASSGAIVSP